ncbi:GTP-binding protein [Lentzea sp.]|uniref:GTP-binding protein n=1 Tax=Lentzea sp. TaxID=56099 RepID=UPI002CECE423|nr:GTP-binding protein [Lentzea sp.]HUQ59679.1 GTP-binding protein [Lentzea sp.]
MLGCVGGTAHRGSVAFRASRPFHPARLMAALADWEGVLRSKGFCHIATRPDVLALWSQAGPNLTLEPGELLDSPQGRQELVFIGVGLDLDEPRRRLEPALLTEQSVHRGGRAGCHPPRRAGDLGASRFDENSTRSIREIDAWFASAAAMKRSSCSRTGTR